MLNYVLTSKLSELLNAEQFQDYAPNGLQVEGKAEITRIVTGVTASLALIEAAKQCNADAILVHHGWFWKKDNPCLTGFRLQRVRTLLSCDMNLIAYHLPLDAHPVLGNNARLARELGLLPTGTWGEMNMGWIGHPENGEMSAGALAEQIGRRLGREPLLAGDPEKTVRTVAWCSGAAQGFYEEAIAQGADLYLSGEISEPTVHLARETGTVYLACGHHATERYGIRALGDWVRDNCGIEVRHIDIDNPV